MIDSQKRMEAQTLDLGSNVAIVVLFIVLSGLMWWTANDFSVSQPEGFDPLRYEYYARQGLPQAFSESSSYRMVVILDIIYRYLPFYTGYLVFVGVLCFLVRYFDYSRIISMAVFSPISFYFIGQTGKDGLAIIATIATGIIVTSKPRPMSLLFCSIAIVLALYVRPAILLMLPLVFIQFRWGTLWALACCPFMILLFSQNVDTYLVLNSLESLTSDEGAGRAAQLLRTYTFGYETEALLAKFSLLFFSFVFQPLLGLVKYYSGSPEFVLYESSCYLVFVYFVFRKKMLLKFCVTSIPYVLILGATTPFYHFRYLAIMYPMIFAYCLLATGYGLRPSAVRSARANEDPPENSASIRKTAYDFAY